MVGKFVLAVHGGAGTLAPEIMTVGIEQSIHSALRKSLLAGNKVLAAGGPAIDAVTAAVIVLEDDSLFNAGYGAVFNAAGRQEMDAAVMDGATRAAGAVAGICGPRNPVLAGARGDGSVQPRHDDRRRRDGVRPRLRRRIRGRGVFPDRAPLARLAGQARRPARREHRPVGRRRPPRHRRGGRPGHERRARGGDFDGWHDGETARPGGGQPADRRRHLGVRPGRCIGHGGWRALHPRRRRSRDQRQAALCRPVGRGPRPRT